MMNIFLIALNLSILPLIYTCLGVELVRIRFLFGFYMG